MIAMTLYGRDLITTQDWSIDELVTAMKFAGKFREIRRKAKLPPKILERKCFFMLFWAPSTRTRAAFEAGMGLLGGHAPYIDMATTRVASQEVLKDVARMYGMYGDGIGVRILDEAVDFVYGSGQRVVQQVAEVAKVPVINMGCCTFHPTQAIGDMMTVRRKVGNPKGKKYAITWAYSSKMRGRCSIQEELLIATRFGMNVVLAHPKGFEIDPRIVKSARKNARDSGGSFEVSNDFEEALAGANVVFARSWVTSDLSKVGASVFGVDNELKIHSKYRCWKLKQTHVRDLMAKSAIVTHVLPVFRGEEATAEAIDGPNSVIYEQAEDSFYAKMAVLSLAMAGNASYRLK